MDIGKIVRDSLRYPFLDWGKFLMLGLFLVISSLNVYYYLKGISLTENVLIGSFILIKCVLGLLIVGYLFRIVKSSLGDAVRLPAFNSWFDMFVDGFKVFLVNVVYFMPIILIILIFLVLLSSNSGVIFKLLELYPSNIVNVLFMSLFYLKSGIWFISLLYMVIVLPILQMAVVHMAYNGGKFGAAFRFHEILNKIGSIGWKNFIVWYVVTGFLYLLIYVVGMFVLKSFGFFSYHYFGIKINIILELLSLLIITPFLFIYIHRAMALFYRSK